VVILAAYIVASPRNPPPGPSPGDSDIDFDALYGKWEELSLINARPAAGDQFLWLKVELTNNMDDDLLIAPMAFRVEDDEGTGYNGSDDDSEGIISSGASTTFNVSIEVPTGWAPTEVIYTYDKDNFTDTAPTIAALIPDIAISGLEKATSNTDSEGVDHSPQHQIVLNVSFDMKNQWTEIIDTFDATFTVVDAGENPVTVFHKTGPDALNAGLTAHYYIEFLIPQTYVPKMLLYDMGGFGPYGNATL